jgi:hypothetical protein
MVIALALALWLVGNTRGLFGAAVGTSIGVLAAVGLGTATSETELARMYAPALMAANVAPLGVVTLVLGRAAPYVTGPVAAAWAIGAVAAAWAAVPTGQADYLVPPFLHATVAGLVVLVAARRTRRRGEGMTGLRAGQRQLSRASSVLDHESQ